MAAPGRLYLFIDNTVIEPGEVNAELNQIIAALVNVNTDGTPIVWSFAKTDTTDLILSGKVTGDAYNRFELYASNNFRFGDGTVAPDAKVSSTGAAFSISTVAGGDLTAITLNATDVTISNDIGVTNDLAVTGDTTLTGKLIGEPVAFSVHKNGLSQTISSSSATKLTWSTEDYDTNSDFSSDRFTPQIQGIYRLIAVARFETMSDGDFMAIEIRKNGIAYKSRVYPASSLVEGSLFISADAEANGSSDYFEVFVTHTEGTNQDIQGAASETYFQGSLIALSST